MEWRKRREGKEMWEGGQTKKIIENGYGLENHRILVIKHIHCEWVGK